MVLKINATQTSVAQKLESDLSSVLSLRPLDHLVFSEWTQRGGTHCWQDIRAAISKEDTKSLLEDFMGANEAALPNDAMHPWPSA
jgi:hypothetical protein